MEAEMMTLIAKIGGGIAAMVLSWLTVEALCTFDGFGWLKALIHLALNFGLLWGMQIMGWLQYGENHTVAAFVVAILGTGFATLAHKKLMKKTVGKLVPGS